MTEKWKDIPGFEGIYEASNHGRIRSSEGKTTYNVLHGVVHWKQRIIKQHVRMRKHNRAFDSRVTLWKHGKPYYFLTARLIAMTWCPGYTEGMTVNHIDGNPGNNCADNLEWVSRADNIRLGFENGLYPQKSVTLIDKCGNVHHFKSMSSASRFLGKSSGYISDALKDGRIRTPDGYLIHLT